MCGIISKNYRSNESGDCKCFSGRVCKREIPPGFISLGDLSDTLAGGGDLFIVISQT